MKKLKLKFHLNKKYNLQRYIQKYIKSSLMCTRKKDLMHFMSEDFHTQI